FDDPTSSSEAFRGFYLRTRRAFSLPVSVDLYLLDKQLDRVTYARGTGREDRWTGGGRAAGKLASLDYAIEGAYQFGTFGSADISAWGFFADVSRAVPAIVTEETWNRAQQVLRSNQIMAKRNGRTPFRSEEHTSELQSLTNLV